MEAKVQQMQMEKIKRDKELNEALQYLELQRLTAATPRRVTLETPGPHTMQAKTPRQQDIDLQQKIEMQTQAEAELKPTQPTNPDHHLVDVFKQLTQVMKESNTSDTTEPAPFNGSDERWDEFYAQLRTYLSAKSEKLAHHL